MEHWSATFSNRIPSGKEGGLSTPQAPAMAPRTGDDATIGQTLISVQLTPENKDTLPPAPPGAKTSRVDVSGQRQDVNSSYIHANLPNQATKGDTWPGTGQQSGKEKEQDNPKLQSTGGQVRQQQGPTDGGTSQPLVFSLDQTITGVSSTVGRQATTAPSPLHQTTGLPVSESHVMDQVIHHFSGGRQLESGSVVLRLHPQELGELRMEIKVKQDNIKAHITTNNPQVQDILDRHLPRLREALEQQGLNLEQMQVTVATGDNSNTQLFQEHRGHQQERRTVRSIGPSRSAFSIMEDDGEQFLQAGDRSLSIHA